jgi:F-type H+-transporting ATPase subunit b
VELNGTLILQVVIFCAALLWLSPVLFRPILILFDERERRIKDAKDEGEKLSQLALEKARKFDAEYAKATHKAREFLSHTKQASDAEHLERLTNVKREAAKKLSEAQEKLKEQVKDVKNELDDKANMLAQDIVNSLLRSKV